jgi:hypothetical protein
VKKGRRYGFIFAYFKPNGIFVAVYRFGHYFGKGQTGARKFRARIVATGKFGVRTRAGFGYVHHELQRCHAQIRLAAARLLCRGFGGGNPRIYPFFEGLL